jgi:hypothetical protein
VGVAVGEDGGPGVEGLAPDVGEAQRHVDGSLRAWATELRPGGLDKVGEAKRLLHAGREPLAVRRRPPGLEQRGADDLDLGVHGQADLVELGAQPLQQHRRAGPVVTKDLGVAAAVRGKQGSQLAGRGIMPGHGDLQHGALAIGHCDFRHERLGSPRQGSPDRQAPLARQVAHQAVQRRQPVRARRAFGQGLQSHHVRDIDDAVFQGVAHFCFLTFDRGSPCSGSSLAPSRARVRQTTVDRHAPNIAGSSPARNGAAGAAAFSATQAPKSEPANLSPIAGA